MSAVLETTAKKLAAAFLSTLMIERADNPDSGKWILTHPLVYRSLVAGETFVVPVGFQTDFASVPRLPIIYWLTGGVADEAAVVHDYLYTMRKVSRKIADDVLAEASKVMGVPAWRRGMMWLGVRVGGGSHWKDQADNPQAPEDAHLYDG